MWKNTVPRLYNNINETDTTLRVYKDYITDLATLQLQLVSVQFARETFTANFKVSLLEVDSLWGDCTFIPADWGS